MICKKETNGLIDGVNSDNIELPVVACALEVVPRDNDPAKTQFPCLGDAFFNLRNGAYLSAEADFANGNRLWINRNILQTRRNRCGCSEIDRRFIHTDAARNIDEHVILSDVKSAPLFKYSQEHRETLGVKPGRCSLGNTIAGRRDKRLYFNQQWSRPLHACNDGGSGGT